MLSTGKRLNLVSFEKYRSPIYVSKGKEKYVYFYVLDPDSVLNGEPRLKRIRKKFNHIKTKKERDEAALRFRAFYGSDHRIDCLILSYDLL